jgi:hypothetical protein
VAQQHQTEAEFQQVKVEQVVQVVVPLVWLVRSLADL